jgi:hypothetical protein
MDGGPSVSSARLARDEHETPEAMEAESLHPSLGGVDPRRVKHEWSREMTHCFECSLDLVSFVVAGREPI